jgi:ubiquinone/menaquinone biosynthesis C-methylase UbiE
MSSYLGRYAAFYDLIYAEKPYLAEATFVASHIEKLRGARPNRWLDVACGTGRHALCLSEMGFDVLGLDYSKDQLEQARQKARLTNSKARFDVADMRELDLGAQRFDAISCLFDSIGYAQTNDGVLATLNGLRRHLSPTGVVALEFWHAPAMLKHYDPFRVRRWPLAAGELVRISESTLDVAAQTCSVKYTLHELHADGTFSTCTETQVNRFFLLQEMKALLTAAGLELVEAFAGFDESSPISSETWHVVALAKHTPRAAGSFS